MSNIADREKKLRLRAVHQSLRSASSILVDVDAIPDEENLQMIVNAANQARQAAKDLDVLEGLIRGALASRLSSKG